MQNLFRVSEIRKTSFIFLNSTMSKKSRSHYQQCDSVDKLLVYDNLSHIAFDETRYASRGSLSTLDDRSA